MIRHFLLVGFLIVLLASCKVTQTVSPMPEPVAQSDTLVSEPVEIAASPDTLPQEVVDIPIHRLLPDTVSIAAVGDIMMGTKFPNSSYLPPNNGEFLWADSRELLRSADITFGNLEGTVLDGEGEPKDCKNPDACYLFKMPTRITSNLVDCGFDLMSLANNHANDFGETGRKSTLRTLDSLGIAAAGSTERPYTVERIGHLRVGFVAFAPNKGTLGFYDLEMARGIIAHLDSLSDLVIVSIHGGAEGAKNMHVTRETEFYFGENRGNIYHFSHEMIDAGADLILGHGPHVPRALEVYNKRMIAYSLGNFCTYGRFNLKGPSGEAPLLIAKTKSNGEFVEGQLYAFRQSYDGGPEWDTQKTVIQTIRNLSAKDFPENPIEIDEQGRINYIQPLK